MLDIAAAVSFSLWKVLCGGVPEYVRNLLAFVRTGATVTIRDGKSANAFVLARLPGLSRPVNRTYFLGACAEASYVAGVEYCGCYSSRERFGSASSTPRLL